MTHCYTLAFAFLVAFFAAAKISAQCSINVSAGEDIYLCSPPTPTQLDGSINGDYLNFNWSPTTGLTGVNTLTPTVNVNQNMTYILTANAADLNNNLIFNGDFEGGNSDFTSDYNYSPGDLWLEGTYDVISNPQSSHPNFAPCTDHSGGGNMMVVNGAGVPNTDVWCQTVSVDPGTQYVFSAWLASVVSASPALLQFSINGTPIGTVFGPPSQNCVWVNFYATWNSGGNSSATICIVNMNTALSGNDFAIDDIVFSPVCTVKDTVKVNVVNITAVASPSLSLIPCEGANITLNGTGSSTGANITYNWDTSNGNIVSGQNTLSPVVNAPGMYTLTVTFDNGQVSCTKTATVNVGLSANQLTAWINLPPPIGCGAPTVTLVGNSSQSAFSTYQWEASNGGNIVGNPNIKNVLVDQPGTYTLLVTNTSTGCTATAEVTVTTATNPPTAIANAGPTITCTQPTTSLSGTGSTTGPNIVYAWTTSNGTIVSGQSSLNAVAGTAGTYIFAVTNNSNNCTAYDTVVVNANVTLPTVSIQTPDTLDCDTDTLTLAAVVTPSTATIVWSGSVISGQGTLNPQLTTTGVYAATVTNPINGCTASASVTVVSDYTPPVAVTQPADTLTCQQSSVTLSGNGSSTGANFSYNWTASPGGNIVSGHQTLNPVVNASGTYTLLVTDLTNACTATATVPVAADTNIVVAVANAPDTLTCAVDTVALNTNGSSSGSSFTYAWTTTDGNITGGADTPNPTANTPGTYQLLLTNTANGCSATDLAIVAQNTAVPNVQIAPPDTLTCAHPTQTIQAQNLSLPGSFVYLWTAANGGNIVLGDSTLSPLINAAGQYILTTTNLVSGCTVKDTVTVSIETGTPVAIIAPPGLLTCLQKTRTLNTSGSSTGPNYTYNWSTVNGNITTGADTPSPTVDQPGQYILLITNTLNGCTATTSVTVVQSIAPPEAVTYPAPVLTCLVPQFTLEGDGTGNATWSTIGGHIVSGGDNFSNCLIDAPGLYILSTVDPSNGCTASDTVQVTANQQSPALSIATPGILSCLQATLTLMATATGNTPLAYQWQTNTGQFVSGQNSSSPVVDAPGDYIVTVTDGLNGCSNTASIVVDQDIAQPDIQISQPSLVTCTNPTQTILAQNLSLPGNFTYTWSATAGGNIVSGNNSLSPIIDAGGDYMITTTNLINGCTSVFAVNVQQNKTPPVADAGASDTLSCSVNSLTINGSGTGTGTLTYLWTASNGGNILSGYNTPTPVVDEPGTFILLVTNTVNGCTATDAVQIFNDLNAPQANAGLPITLTCAVSEATLNATASTGSNFTYSWTASGGGSIASGGNTLTPLVNEPGTYTLAVTNEANGCVATSQVVVDQNVASPPVGVAPPGILTCAVTNLSLGGMPASGNYTWLWQTADGHIVSGNNTANPIIDQPGSYTLVVIDQQNGCSATAFSIVSEDVAAPVIAAAAPQTLTCAVVAVPVNGSVIQPSSGFTAHWTTADGHIVMGQNLLTAQVDAPGTYVLTVENDLNGCTTTAQAIVSQNITPPSAQAAAPDVITCADPAVSLSGAGSSVGPGFSYAWSGGQITGGQNTLAPTVSAAGAYTLTVTDLANGCISIAVTVATENTTPPTIAIGMPGLLTCVQHSVVLSGNLSGSATNFSAAWTTTNGHFISGQSSLSPVVDLPGTYILNVVNLDNGCSNTAQTMVSQNIVPPGADAGPAPELNCNQLEVTLQGSSPAGANALFEWNTSDGNIVSGAATPTPVADAIGTYSVTVTSLVNGCTSTDMVEVTEVPPPAFVPELIQPDCHDSKGAVDFGTISGGSAPFSYSKDGGQTFVNQSFFNNVPPGVYDLVVRDVYGCTDEASVEIEEPFLPAVSLPAAITIEMGSVIYLEPVLNQAITNIVTWQWSPADWLSCADCPFPVAKPLRSTGYTLTITDLNGCKAQAKVNLIVDRRRHLYAPNIFSPNGDGVNDVFTLFGRGVKEVRSLQIFDRWGAELFLVEHLQVNDEVRGWNGTFRGKELNPAVFVWQAVVEFEDGQVEVLAGDVALER